MPCSKSCALIAGKRSLIRTLRKDVRGVARVNCVKVFVARNAAHAASGNTHMFCTAGDDEMAESLPICSACSPQHQKYTCTVCDKTKERRQFDARALQRQKRSSILRCKACFTCNICHEQKSDGRCFETATRRCWVCRPSRMFRCDVCGDSKGEAHFAPHVLENAQKHSRKRVCMMCSEKGYTSWTQRPTTAGADVNGGT